MPPVTDNSNKDKSSILKTTREAKGLTLEIVHEATKIPMDALKAIEEGYSSRILSPFYYRGFIKIYSEFLGLNIAEMYKEYGIDQPPKPPVSASETLKPKRPQRAGPNPLLEHLQEGTVFLLKPQTLSAIAQAAGFVILLFVLVKIGGCVAGHIGKRAAVPHRHAAMVAHEKKIAPPAPAPVREAVQARAQDNRVEVAVRATRNTWLRVKTDDKIVFEATLPKGSMESWSADDTIELSGRNIERLDMEINGKHVGTLGAGERRIRRVLITPEGLTVKK